MAVSQQVSQKPRQFRHFDNPFTRRVTGNTRPFGVEKSQTEAATWFGRSSGAPGSVDWFKTDRRGAPSRCPAIQGGHDMQLLCMKDVERQLGVSKSTIYRLIKEGEFDVVKIGHSVRVTEESLDAYITTHTTFGTAVTR